jgi:Phosphotransferase enzyme family
MNVDGPALGLLERTLSEAFGQPVAVVHVDRIQPWFVARATVATSAADAPTSVIVKWLREHPTNFRTDPRQLVTERAALEFLADLEPPIAPRLLAHDDRAGLLVLEDLAPRQALFDLLRRGAPDGPVGLQAFARTLGRLHAATAGRADLYYRHRRSRGSADPEQDHRRVVGESWPWTFSSYATFGIDVTRGAEAELRIARDILTNTGPFSAFSNGDAGANNFFVDGVDGRIIDWEFAGYRHALVDAACLYVPGPMWMTVANPEPSALVDTYRTELVKGVPAALDDDLFETGMAAACIVMAVERLERLPLLESRPPGHESRAQMVSTLEAASRALHAVQRLPHLAEWASTTATTLRHRWPDADRTFPDAYTTRE